MIENSKCPFCEEFKKDIEIHEYYASKRDGFKNCKVIRKIALVIESYSYSDEPNRQTGCYAGQHHELNFCPVCGKKITNK